MSEKRSASLLVLAAAFVLAAAPANAQTTTCKTANCAVGTDAGGNPNLPVACQQLATPRTIEVRMTNLSFVPPNIRIEGESLTPGVPWGYQCIRWRNDDSGAYPPPWHSATDDTAGDSCDTSTTCNMANITPPCDWEAGNIDVGLEFSVCHYAAVAPGSHSLRCRLHWMQGMTGTLTVVSPIQLRVNKNANGDVLLSWDTGGVGPWLVFRDDFSSMLTPLPMTQPTLARSLTDSAPVGDKYYLVMEWN